MKANEGEMKKKCNSCMYFARLDDARGLCRHRDCIQRHNDWCSAHYEDLRPKVRELMTRLDKVESLIKTLAEVE